MPNGTHTGADLYVCRDHDGEIIYIGWSTRLERRLDEHRWSSPWWPDVDKVDHFHFADVEIAKQRCIDAIAAVRPMHNIAHVNRDQTSGWVRPAKYSRRNGAQHRRAPVDAGPPRTGPAPA